MKAKTKNEFRAVEYMRKVRNDLSTLIQTDKKRFHAELKKAMNDFIARREKSGSHLSKQSQHL